MNPYFLPCSFHGAKRISAEVKAKNGRDAVIHYIDYADIAIEND
jgi:hypothetical protein